VYRCTRRFLSVCLSCLRNSLLPVIELPSLSGIILVTLWSIPIEFSRIPNLFLVVFIVITVVDLLFRIFRHPQSTFLTILDFDIGFRVHRLCFFIDFELAISKGKLESSHRFSIQFVSSEAARRASFPRLQPSTVDPSQVDQNQLQYPPPI
jgi:hypothetical protein